MTQTSDQDPPPSTLLLAGPFGQMGHRLAAKLSAEPGLLVLAGGRETEMQVIADELNGENNATVQSLPGDLSHSVTRDVLALELENVDILVLDGSELGPLPDDDEAAEVWRRHLSSLAGLARALAEDMEETDGRIVALVDDDAGGRVLNSSLPLGVHRLSLVISPDVPIADTVALLMNLLTPASLAIRSGTLIPINPRPAP
ncbi:hypothetical protein [Magnetospira sp. QH-2]|uniref:hypothetical protein n=1 Tax=Magnetospira sp. (strain QH-2) TaxID=1288970 RepID=UPI0003E80AD5|nr:hypothetical protein [Magnetospira sp. QH-2]CCQ73647.1 Protein of unknown function [Magnetospira sp. QH-2]